MFAKNNFLTELNAKFSTTRLCYKLIPDEYLDECGKIKEEVKFKINLPELGIMDSKIPKQGEEKFDTYLFLPPGEGRQGEGGLRTKGYFKFSYEIENGRWFACDFRGKRLFEVEPPEGLDIDLDQFKSDDVIIRLPLITVITVVLNGEKYLEETIQSVINQTYPNVEYIIIDGCSTDGTLDIIKKYENQLDYWVSEKDKGIYDAMNKGVIVSIGDFVYFLGSDDVLFSSNLFLSLLPFLSGNDIIYGKVLLKSNKKIYGGRFSCLKIMLSNICHQSIIYRKTVFKNYGFYDLKYFVWADHEFNMRIFCKIQKKYIDKVFSIYNDFGFSSNNYDKLFLKEQGFLINRHLGWHYFLLFRVRKVLVKVFSLLKLKSFLKNI